MEIQLQKAVVKHDRREKRQEKLQSSFFWFSLFGLSFMSTHSLIEILYGNGYTHPIWSDTFNWFPLILQVIIVSFISSFVYAYTDLYATTTQTVKQMFGSGFKRPTIIHGFRPRLQGTTRVGSWLQGASRSLDSTIQSVLRFLTRSTQPMFTNRNSSPS